jgi:hypothetical protein
LKEKKPVPIRREMNRRVIGREGREEQRDAEQKKEVRYNNLSVGHLLNNTSIELIRELYHCLALVKHIKILP